MADDVKMQCVVAAVPAAKMLAQRTPVTSYQNTQVSL